MVTRRGARGDREQLSLFAPTSAPDPDSIAMLEREHANAAELTRRIPESIRFGCSSWSFPGWRGLVFSATRTVEQLAFDGLVEYSRHPLLRAVGVDRGYYAPIPPRDWERYATQVPPGFSFCTKAYERIVSPIVTERGRVAHGQKLEPNPDYLSVEAFDRLCLAPMRYAGIEGPIVFEFPRTPFSDAPEKFARDLDAFLGALPRERPYSVEVRERANLTPGYVEVLRKHGVGHVYNYWTAMPSIARQRELVKVDGAPIVVVRLMLSPGKKYASQKEAFAPFDRIVEADAKMRAEVIELLQEAARTGIPVRVLVNNKAEGSAPLTVRAIAEGFVGVG